MLLNVPANFAVDRLSITDTKFADLAAQVHQECAKLRFAEGLRRRWAPARAEACLQEAFSQSVVEGLRIEIGELRQAVLLETRSADLLYARGLWCANWRVTSLLADLNAKNPQVRPKTAPIQLLASLHKDVCTILVQNKSLEVQLVAKPIHQSVFLIEQRELEVWRQNGQISGLAAVAWTWGRIASGGLFDVNAGSVGAVAADFAKWQLAELGIEPTGVAILSRQGEDALVTYTNSLNAFVRGDFAPWYQYVCQAILRGCAAGHQVVRTIQAGVLPE